MRQKEIILFGAGNFGHEALYFLGKENVKCFCDNNPEAMRSHVDGKIEIISFEELKREYKDSIVIVCAMNPDVVCEIAEQCEGNGVYDYVSYGMLITMGQDRNECLTCIRDAEKREKLRKELWKNRICRLEKQVDYFKRHADIRAMKPAEGKLRDWQLRCVHAAAEVMKKIEKLGIHPFLYGANLIGHVRHNGFVPWDDDIDFGLIRSEYEKLRNYCRENLQTYEKYTAYEKMGKERSGMADFCWACYPGNFVIFYQSISIDFFVFDYFSDEYPFEDMLECATEVRNVVKTLHSTEEKNQYLEAIKAENRLQTVEKSSSIYFGVDDMGIDHKYHKGGYIPEGVLFPLKKVIWEGECFYAPNNPEELLDYVYGDIWEFPKDIGVPKHYEVLGVDESYD